MIAIKRTVYELRSFSQEYIEKWNIREIHLNTIKDKIEEKNRTCCSRKFDCCHTRLLAVGFSEIIIDHLKIKKYSIEVLCPHCMSEEPQFYDTAINNFNIDRKIIK